MEKKNNLIKNIFFVFFACCFLTTGITALNKTPQQIALAEDVSSIEIENDLPEYFVAEEYYKQNEILNATPHNDGLIDQDTFMYFESGQQSNALKLSFAMGNASHDSTNDRYNWVYYPDPDNISLFYYYTIENITLYINGVEQNITFSNFRNTNNLFFDNRPTARLDNFEMIFTSSLNPLADNEIKITDEEGNVIEGIYTVNVTYILHTCTDGGTTGDEAQITDSTNNPTVSYSFYCVDRDSYFQTGRPNINSNNFDHTVPVTNLTNPLDAYYLYSNYSYKSEDKTTNKIPYIEYDFTKFELELNKELSNSGQIQSLLYDKDTKSVVSSGDNIVNYIIKDNTCQVYFTDVGNYTIKLNPIAIIDFQVDILNSQIRKYNLSGISSITKNILVYMFGYQASYTDYDAPLNSNNNRPTSELKDYDFENGEYLQTADITSQFLNSNDSYSQDNYSETFTISNILNYLNNQTPVVTDQAPIKFSTNATLNSSYSYIYTTTANISNLYSETNHTLNGNKLYRAQFTGKADSANGDYIYVIAYTFKNYFNTENTLLADKTFYQIFYFKIDKLLPKFTTYTPDEKSVATNSFTNQDVIIDISEALGNIYNKDITLQVYAYNYDTDTYMSEFGANRGISFDYLLGIEKHKVYNGDVQDLTKIKLVDGAKYTIRLYHSNEITADNIILYPNLEDNRGFLREHTFTIDKTDIENITARNVTEIANSTNYQAISNLTSFATNQNFVVSWNEKNSGAKTFAYYRYFPIVEQSYYYTTDTQAEERNSNLLEKLLASSATNSYMPVNYRLDFSVDENIWLPYKGNSGNVNETNISAEYVFTDSGLYFIDVYDEAGNHSLEIFFRDNTTPIFAINDGTKYSLTSPSMFITADSTLYWSKYKAIKIINMPNSPSFLLDTPESLADDFSNDAFYKNYEENCNKEIYEKLYYNLHKQNYIQYLDIGLSNGTESYNGYYLTIPINSVSYYTDGNSSADNPFNRQENVYSQKISAEKEMTYTVLIRDLSNTKMMLDYPADVIFQYTTYYSAKQTLIISMDDSEFFIKYQDQNGEYIPLTSNLYTESGADNRKAKITYLSPTNMEEDFIISFIPTIYDDEKTIQVDEVTIDYYPFVAKDYKVNNITYHYYTIDENNKTPIQIYKFGEGGNVASEETITEEIRLNAEGITAPGKYVISRTYKIDDIYSFNPKDYYKRTFEFYVDRNEVISNAELVTDENENNISSHLESLVGGDIFIAMYDNKTNADLVVTFPDAPLGNNSGSSLYNTNNVVRSVLTTNMLPVRIYVPAYKYTTYAEKIITENGYDYKVNYETDTDKNINNFYYNSSLDQLAIQEYKLFAEIYYQQEGETNRTLIANTSTSQTQINTGTQTNGFLDFYNVANGEKLSYLTDAGSYFVTIYQGKFSSDPANPGGFEQSITFSFDIQKSIPDFEAQNLTGATLNSTVPQTEEISTYYYTNQSNINLIWQAGKDYIADIDIDNIHFVVRNATGGIIHDKWTNNTTNKNLFFSNAPELANELYIAQINFEKLGMYHHGYYIDITMQYKNHDPQFYDTVTKRIYIDLSAPNTNITNLVNRSLQNNKINLLTESALRTHYNAKMEKVTDNNVTSYNTSNDTGIFSYYSFTTTSDFKNILTLTNDADHIYVRLFENKYTSDAQETTPAEFNELHFNRLDEITFENNNYYEIVERDLAGNMTIYTIYIVSYQEDPNNKLANNLITYTTGDTQNYYTIADYNEVNAYAGATHNIYSKTGFNLENINFFGDVWAQISLTTYDVNGQKTDRILMLTPWDKENVYMFYSNTQTKVAISDLIDGETSTRYKNKMSIYNRENGSTTNFYFSIKNTSLTPTLTDNKDEEYIRFSLPSDVTLLNELYSATFLSRIKIYAEDTILCDVENKLGFGNIWQQKFAENDKITVTIENERITFAINPNLNFEDNTRITYEYTDNYGKTEKEIHLYRESVIAKEIDSNEDLYSYYETSTGRLYYITKNEFKYLYNPKKYEVNILCYNPITNETYNITDEAIVNTDLDSSGIETKIVSTNKLSNYDDTFVIEVKDKEDTQKLIKSIYFKLYNQLPKANTTENSVNNLEKGEFIILDTNGINITNKIIGNSIGEEGYYSEIRILYKNLDNTFIPIKYSISTDNENWEEVSSGTFIRCESQEMQKFYLKIWYQENYLINEMGNPQYVFGNVPSSQIYTFNLSSLTSTYWIEKTVDGVTEIVEQADSIYTDKETGKQYSNHYIVNISYANRSAITIKTNKEQNIVVKGDAPIKTIPDSSLVQTEIYELSNKNADGTPSQPNIPPFEATIAISYVPNTDNFVEEFYTYSLNGSINKNENLVNLTTKNLIVSQNYSLNKTELQWTKYYGLEENIIDIEIYKDNIKMNPTIYSKKVDGIDYNYCYLTYSGKYTISLKDQSGNIQKFNRGNVGQTDQFTLIFLKDVPFTVTYTDIETGEEITTLPIKEAIYNTAVTINIDPNTRAEFYSLSGFPTMSVKRNGVEYTNEFQDDTTYIFEESGYYEITFTATSLLDTQIRQETYQFTILNPNEHRYSYVYNKYSNYYVEKVLKNGEDITDILVKTLDLQLTTIDKKEYLTSLPLSSMDDKTGAGTYIIYINTNDSTFKNSTGFKYQVKIQTGTAPINISIAEGDSTTKNIIVNFNQTNIYREMGECILQIVKYQDDEYAGTVYSLKINETTLGEASASITSSGTHYIQIVSPSNTLLYSYKVIKNEPLNAAAIISIVISVVVLIVVIIIIIKLRKRISVK